MSGVHILLRNQYIPCIIVILAHLGGIFHVLPVFGQLLLNSCCCVYTGCMLGNQIMKKDDKFIKVQGTEDDEETIGTKQALKFPIVASLFLFGIYLLYKYVDPNILNLLITSYFCIATVFSNAQIIWPKLPLPESTKKVFYTMKMPHILKKYLQFQDIQFSVSYIVSIILIGVPVGLYFVTKHWILNNMFGILFSITALRYINLGSFKVGFILLWLLFFYDIFWVYFTDVMVDVAKKLDIPIKLLFPYLNDLGQLKFSMLGLGDIVLPGIFVSLCLKFDVDKTLAEKSGSLPKSPSQFKLTYFHVCFIGYILGICETFSALYIFDHAQPALLFLVPMCTLSVLLWSLFKGQFKQLQEYSCQIKKPQELKQK